MGLVDIEHLLKKSIGLNVASIGSFAIARAVEERSTACQLESPAAYWEYVRGADAELQDLVESVVVPETWFFRDRESFGALARLVCETYLPQRGGRVVSLLSLPCSTGEEPYSMAMALLDASVPADRFRVEGVDVSARGLQQASRGIFGRNSFRGQELAFRDRHFEATDEGYRLSETVRRQVHFQSGNLVADDFMPGVHRYDVVFCRNLLIYFDRATQDGAFLVLKRLLKPDGALFVAPAETGLASTHGFASLNFPLAFAFGRAVAPPAVTRSVDPRVLPSTRRPSAAAVTAGRAPRNAAVPQTAPSVARPPAPQADDLAEIERLADQGHVAEAAARCETHLYRHGPSSTAFYLMGLVRDATGHHDEAGACYRKALYLEPNHLDAQLHLALLLEKQGDQEGARLLRNRARRLQQERGFR